MNFWDVFGEMLVILFAIAAGYAANRLGYLGGEADQKVSKLLLNITMPAMIVAAVITGEELPELGTILSILEVGVVRRSLPWWCPGSCRAHRGRRACGGMPWPSPTWGSLAIP